jgi:hypothetical protein
MTEFRKLAREFTKPKEKRNLDRSLKYNQFSEKEISLRTYQPKKRSR